MNCAILLLLAISIVTCSSADDATLSLSDALAEEEADVNVDNFQRWVPDYDSDFQFDFDSAVNKFRHRSRQHTSTQSLVDEAERHEQRIERRDAQGATANDDGKDVMDSIDAMPEGVLPPAMAPVLTPIVVAAITAPSEGNLNELCSRVDCARHGACLSCNFDARTCQLGETSSVNCTTHVACRRQHTVVRANVPCRYCWQTREIVEHRCQPVRNCSSNDVRLHRTNCRVAPHVLCMGRRTFYKNIKCRWTNGYSWSRAMFSSVTLGGFGVDRFYLGLWKSGIGKLFSFGGLGVWTIVDIVLIAIGYIQPADGSMYI